MPQKEKRGTKRKLAAELRSPAQEAGVDSDVSTAVLAGRAYVSCGAATVHPPTMDVAALAAAAGGMECPKTGVTRTAGGRDVLLACSLALQYVPGSGVDTPTVLLLLLMVSQVKVLIHTIRAACERPVDKIDRQQLRKQAHQLADYCKDGRWPGAQTAVQPVGWPTCFATPLSAQNGSGYSRHGDTQLVQG